MVLVELILLLAKGWTRQSFEVPLGFMAPMHGLYLVLLLASRRVNSLVLDAEPWWL